MLTRSPASELSCWFDQHLRPHEPLLRAWLRTRFPRLRDLDDVVQDSYLRVLRARNARPLAAPKAFLFAVAKNVVMARMRRGRGARDVSTNEVDIDKVADAGADVPREVTLAQESALLHQAIRTLPNACRRILELRKLQGFSQREVAIRLCISEHTVEAQSTIALRKLGEFFARIDRSSPQPYRG